MRRLISVLMAAALMAAILAIGSGPVSAQASVSPFCFEDQEYFGTNGDICGRFISTPSGNFAESTHFRIDEPQQPTPGEGAVPLKETAASPAPNDPGDFVTAGALTPTGDFHGGVHHTGANNPAPEEPPL